MSFDFAQRAYLFPSQERPRQHCALRARRNASQVVFRARTSRTARRPSPKSSVVKRTPPTSCSAMATFRPCGNPGTFSVQRLRESMRCSKLASGTRARLGAPGSRAFGLRVRSRARRDDERGGRRARSPPRSAKVDHGERALAAATRPARMASVYDVTLPSAMWGRPDSQMSWTRWHSLSKVNSQGGPSPSQWRMV